MKITSSQLKKIIAEEVKKATLKEVFDDSPEAFYSRKLEKLEAIASFIDDIDNLLYELVSNEHSAPDGDVEEIVPLQRALDAFEERVTDMIDAMEAMV